MFKMLTDWHSQLEPKWLRSLITLLAIAIMMAIYGIVVFLLVQGFPYALTYLTRFYSETQIGEWAVTAVLVIAGLTIIWILFRKE